MVRRSVTLTLVEVDENVTVGVVVAVVTGRDEVEK